MRVVVSLGALLHRWAWVYLLSLLLPFAVYDLALKALSMSSQPGLAPTLDQRQQPTQAPPVSLQGLVGRPRRGTLPQ